MGWLRVEAKAGLPRGSRAARGHGIREYARLVDQFGGRNWKKCKGVAMIEAGGQQGLAEVHWYECSNIGKVKLKVKRWL